MTGVQTCALPIFDLRLDVSLPEVSGLLANDTDPDGLPLTVVLESGPSHGSVILNADGTFTYSPGLNYEGPDSFTYRADNGALSAVATVSIAVIPGPNKIPETQPDTYATTEEVPYSRNALQGVLANDIDPDEIGRAHV